MTAQSDVRFCSNAVSSSLDGVAVAVAERTAKAAVLSKMCVFKCRDWFYGVVVDIVAAAISFSMTSPSALNPILSIASTRFAPPER